MTVVRADVAHTCWRASGRQPDASGANAGLFSPRRADAPTLAKNNPRWPDVPAMSVGHAACAVFARAALAGREPLQHRLPEPWLVPLQGADRRAAVHGVADPPRLQRPRPEPHPVRRPVLPRILQLRRRLRVSLAGAVRQLRRRPRAVLRLAAGVGRAAHRRLRPIPAAPAVAAG